MGLQLLAPSIVPLANTDRAPESQSNPTRRLTVLLGAGASLFAGAPSTRRLTDVISARELSGQVLRTLQTNNGTQDANFEDVLHVLVELEALRGTTVARAPSMLRPFLDPSDKLDAITTDFEELRHERFELLETIGSAFDGIDYDRAWPVLYRLLRPLLNTFDIDVFTLNYDQVADVTVFGLSVLSGKGLFDGFGQVIDMAKSRVFRADQYAHWDPAWEPVQLTLAHLHGSLLFAYHVNDPPYAHSPRFE